MKKTPLLRDLEKNKRKPETDLQPDKFIPEVNVKSKTEQTQKKSCEEMLECDGVMENYTVSLQQSRVQLADLKQSDQAESINFPTKDFLDLHKLKVQVHTQEQTIADKLRVIQDLEERLITKKKAYEKGCKTIQHLLKTICNLDVEVNKLKSEVNIVSTLFVFWLQFLICEKYLEKKTVIFDFFRWIYRALFVCIC